MKTPILSLVILTIAAAASAQACRVVSPQELLEESLLSVRKNEMVNADKLHASVVSENLLASRLQAISKKYHALDVLMDKRNLGLRVGKQEAKEINAGIKYACFVVAACAESRKDRRLEASLLTLPAEDIANAMRIYKELPAIASDAITDHVLARYRGFANPYNYGVFVRCTDGKISNAFMYGYALAMGSLAIAGES